MIITNRVGRLGFLMKLEKGSGKIITHTKNSVSVVDPDNVFMRVIRVCVCGWVCVYLCACMRACLFVCVRACGRACVCACVCRGSAIPAANT